VQEMGHQLSPTESWWPDNRRGDFGGLKCPSETFVSFVTDMESVFRKEVNGMYHLNGICRRLL